MFIDGIKVNFKLNDEFIDEINKAKTTLQEIKKLLEQIIELKEKVNDDHQIVEVINSLNFDQFIEKYRNNIIYRKEIR